jgi:hypothetical protein
MFVRILKNASLVVVSTFLTLVMLEALLRVLLEPSQLYSSFHTVPALNQWKREMRFWDQYHGRDELLSGGHDPLLGWDVDIAQDRIRGSRVVAQTPPGDQLRIVAVGDSFTFGLDVDPDENFAALLDAHVGLEVLNMGVPGYGIDQAYLKYMEFGKKYQPDVLLFGIYVSDYERSSIGFTGAAKPQIKLRDAVLNVVGRPVASPQQQLERIDRELAGRIYLVEAVRNFWTKVSIGEAEHARFFAETDNLLRHILRSLQQSLKDEQSLIVVHIPRAEALIEPHWLRDEMSRRLLAIYTELGIAHIDLTGEFVTEGSARTAFERYYVHRENGSVGHLSAAGHATVAGLVIESLSGRFD